HALAAIPITGAPATSGPLGPARPGAWLQFAERKLEVRLGGSAPDRTASAPLSVACRGAATAPQPGRNSMAAPLRVGILNDIADAPGEGGVGRNEAVLRMPVDDLVANGRIDREVEFVNAWG